MNWLRAIPINGKFVFLIMVILSCHIWAASVAARTYYVAETSVIGTGTQESPFATIQEAADVVEAGDTVLLKGGIYVESVTLKASGTESHPIIFRPQPDTGKVILKNPAKEQMRTAVFDLKDVSFIRIEGFHFSDFEYGWAIVITSSQHDHTVLPHKAQGNVIRGNTFENLGIEILTEKIPGSNLPYG
ncbi:chondroitinase-B domain-containing protein [Candidatus Poribacteria bacterium]